MAIAPRASFVKLPINIAGFSTIFDFLIYRFPHIPENEWLRRIHLNLVFDESGKPIKETTPFLPKVTIFYYRETEKEAPFPFDEKILFLDDNILVADKPHFLPVIPSGPFVNESLLYRLQRRTGINSLAPLHRIDRLTAGLVLFSVNPKTRGEYQKLFLNRAIKKTYNAIILNCILPKEAQSTKTICSRIQKFTPYFLMTSDPYSPMCNAITNFTLKSYNETFSYLECHPVTGKKHQIRLHATHIGYGIANDNFYPTLWEKKDDDFKKPLQLLARYIEYIDPITGIKKSFESTQNLDMCRTIGI